jgi:hypothetical protein
LGESPFEASLGYKVGETPSQPISWAWWWALYPSYLGGINKRMKVQSGLGKNIEK